MEQKQHKGEEEILNNTATESVETNADNKQQQEADENTATTDTSSVEDGQTDTSAEAPNLSPEEELARLKDTHLRLMAEYDNYRKRTLKEKSDLILHGGEKVLMALLPVIDDLDIALANMDKAEDLDALREGMKLIYTKFSDYLVKQGVKEIATSEATFDEELHEAIATFPAPSEDLKGKIIDCVKKGYTLGDKVIRHASVVVGQ